MQKLLEGANIKLAAVASTMTGRSVGALLDALVAGTTDPAALAELAQGRLMLDLRTFRRRPSTPSSSLIS